MAAGKGASSNFNRNNNARINVSDFYKKANVFITGSTGFVGKALLEKLLRTCEDVNKIYLLLRPKKGLNISDRLEKLLESAVKPLKFTTR